MSDYPHSGYVNRAVLFADKWCKTFHVDSNIDKIMFGVAVCRLLQDEISLCENCNVEWKHPMLSTPSEKDDDELSKIDTFMAIKPK